MIFTAVMIAGYMSLLVGLAVASPGIGLTGTIISCVPNDWRDWAHAPAYGLLAWLIIQGFRLRGWPLGYAMISGISLTVVFGLWTEVAQGAAPGREASLEDVMKDTAGGIAAAGLILWRYIAASSQSALPAVRSMARRRPMKGL
ncbi:MAG: rane protein of unknown function [Nitrospira sp.]|jgi:VanZ family protein|nr:rane protein of unknown function [Nitrospira sp.]